MIIRFELGSNVYESKYNVFIEKGNAYVIAIGEDVDELNASIKSGVDLSNEDIALEENKIPLFQFIE